MGVRKSKSAGDRMLLLSSKKIHHHIPKRLTAWG